MRSHFIAMALTLSATAAQAQEVMSFATVAKVKEATVFLRTGIEGDEDAPSGSGSGFVIRTEGTTAYLVTNAHVVASPHGHRDVAARRKIRAFFRSGTKSETQGEAEVVASDSRRDLALLRVTNIANLPAPIEIGGAAEPVETMTVYIFGFPFGEKLAMGRGRPPVNVGRGQVSSVRRNARDQLASILLDGALNPGNSGGPVVDTRGRLIGISKATIIGANIGFAIAVPELLVMLDGRVESPNLGLTSTEPARSNVSVEIPLVDPLGRIKVAELLYTSGTPGFERKKVVVEEAGAGEGNDENHPGGEAPQEKTPRYTFGPLEPSEKLPLRIERGRATGAFEVSWPKGAQGLWCQVSYVDGSGQRIYGEPGRYLVDVQRGKEAASATPTYLGMVVDPDADCDLALEKGKLTCEIPGTLHDLNIDIGKVNAPRVVQKVVGDFTMTVKVGGSFQPGPVRTGPKSVPYNGGGLLVWWDEGNYIRLERASMYRNQRVVGFLAFEAREHGTRGAVHNKGGLDPSVDLWLKVERRGNRIAGSFSRDGSDWEALEPMDLEWPACLTVGADAVNSCGDAMTVRFESFTVVHNKRKEAEGER